MAVRFVLGLTLANWLAWPASVSATLQLELRLHLGKADFFEQEPIYAVFELRNDGADTAWVSPFGVAFPSLTPVLTSEGGSAVPRLVFVQDYLTVGEWRGVPVAPGGRLFGTGLLQDEWGSDEPAARGPFIRHLSRGGYDLSARFVSEIGPYAGRVIEAQPVHFSIRARSVSEDRSYEDVKKLTGMATDPRQRSRYLAALVMWVSSRLVAADSGNPYCACLLHNGVQIAKAFGSWPDATVAARLASLRAAVADAQRSLPAGAYAVDAGYADRAELVPPLAGRLGQSLAASVAAQREKEHPRKTRP